MEVSSSDTDDDDCVFREVLRASAREGGAEKTNRPTEDEDEDAGAESDAVEDSDASDSDPDGANEKEKETVATVKEGSGAGRKRPRAGIETRVVNRASGNAPAAFPERAPNAGTEVDAKRGRRSEGFGSAPDPSPATRKSAGETDSEARSLTSASELCLGSPSSATSE